MIPFVRSLGFTQMLTNGAEGYRAKGIHDPSAPIAYPFNNWLNDGRKGTPASFHNTLLNGHLTVEPIPAVLQNLQINSTAALLCAFNHKVS